MPVDHHFRSKSVHRLAFQHYLRTGQRLTSEEWLVRYEHKFNPYHDEIGRFTSSPGVTVSYGKSGGPKNSGKPHGPEKWPHETTGPSRVANGNAVGEQSGGKRVSNDRNDAQPSNPSAPVQSVRSDAVRAALTPPAPIVSRFDLRNRREAVRRLREELGSNPDPVVRGDLDELERRLDAHEAWLDQADRIADREVLEIARTGIPPLDTGMSAVSVLSGEGDLVDLVNVVTAAPIIGGVGKLAKRALAARATEEAVGGAARIIQIGGAGLSPDVPPPMSRAVGPIDAHAWAQ